MQSLFYDSGRNPCRDRIRGNIFCNHRICTDDGPLADRDSGQNRGFLPDPHIVSDDDRTFGINRPGIRCDVPERHIFGISVRIVRNEHAFPRADVFTDPDRIDCGDMHIRTEHAAVTNRYFHRSIVLRHFMSRDVGIAADKTIVPNLNVFFPLTKYNPGSTTV